MSTKLIGLTGRARSGKDTVGTILRDQTYTKTISFAEPIRNALRGMMGLTDEHFHGKLKEVPLPWLGKSPRQLMQTLGTEWGRQIVHDSLWLMLAEQSVDELRAYNWNVAITDVRFENEADLIRRKGGRVWHVRRDGIAAVSAHASEAGVAYQPEFGDVLIDNNGSIEDLERQVLARF